MDPSLLPFLKPLGVVVVGASASPEKLGYGIARNLVGSGYAGAIHFVSPRGGVLFGHPVYPDLQHVPAPADLAILAIPAPAMPDALLACAQRGIHAAILVSAGFREASAEGAVLEEECAATARAHGIRLLGPNCIGIIDTHLPLDTTFLQPPMPERGGIAFLSHSGAFCAAIIDWARGESVGFSQIISLGNQADISETDLLPLLADDPNTRAIVMYLEGVSDGQRFVQFARDAARRKPVIALKVGRTEAGKHAAASHTGALTGSDAVYDAAFARAGVLRASSAQQMFEWARALEACPLPAGRRVAILTDAGGPGVIAADALSADGLALAQLRDSTCAMLRLSLPPAASVRNPVDMLASASPDDYARSLRLLLDDEGVDAALVILPPPPMFAAESVADAVVPVAAASGKPVLVALMGSTLVEEAGKTLHRAGVPTYPFPEQAASALGALAARCQFLLRADQTPDRAGMGFADPPASRVSTRPAELISSYGISVAPSHIATSARQAASLAAQAGFPVALKIVSPDVLHKSDVGGVLLGLSSADEVRRGYVQIMEDVLRHHPYAHVDGIEVQQQILAGQEVILGAVQDPTFGPTILFGSGGIEAEGLRDVAFALAPLGATDAQELIARTWAGRRLDGFRNIPPADKSAVVDALIRLSWLAYDHPEIREVDINPLRVLEDGAVALDVRVVL